MRVGVVVFLHESNTFIGRPTTLADFGADLLAVGPAVRDRLAGTHHEAGGFFAGLAAEGVEAVPVFAARALPSGPVEAGAFAELLGRMDAALDAAGPLDGVLAAPHGAMVAAGTPDADGFWLSRLRDRLPRPAPLIATLDPHANLSPAMVSACDALVAYRTNPHLDQHARGLEAARLMGQALRGRCRPVCAAAFPPLAANIERQATDEPHCRAVYGRAEAARTRPGVLSASLVLGFPYADVPEMGSAAVAVADGDLALARAVADSLAGAWWERRHDFVGRLVPPDEAVRAAADGPGPVCLLDMGDNVGGGSPADGTVLVHELARQGVLPAFACLHDPESQAQARAAGVGGRVRLRAGGRTDGRHGPPFEGDFTVRGLFDGRFTESEPRHGGFDRFDQGPTALVETDAGLTLMLTDRRMAPLSLRQLTTFGVEPARFRALVAKGVHAPAAAYGPVCRRLVRVNTPGSTAADLRAFEYRHRRRPMFPFEPETEWAGRPPGG